MAMSQSPPQSPTFRGGHKIDRTHSETPIQPQSKRDKRRSALAERLEDLILGFTSIKDHHYRQQLQALQVDIGMILGADAHGSGMLQNLEVDIHGMVDRYLAPNSAQWQLAKNGDLSGLAGRIYAEFETEIMNAMELRDKDMTVLADEYKNRLASLDNTNTFLHKLADTEHKALSSSLRDRLINSVNGRRARLNKEKENVEIGETNALLMHPSQFSIANPSSPGGIHAKRATRHRREVDELPGFNETHKRKRKNADDSGSPGPTRRAYDNGYNTPIWTPEQIIRSSSNSATPMYSIDKLFTEKELTMTYNTAAIAAHQYIVSHKADLNGANGTGSTDSNSGDGNEADNENENIDSPPGAATMERQPSHATRSTRGQGNYLISGAGIEVLSDLNNPANVARLSAQMPKMPPPLSQLAAKPYLKDAANAPLGLSYEDATRDIQRMSRSKTRNLEEGVGANLHDPELEDLELLRLAVGRQGGYAAWVAVEKTEEEKMLEKGRDKERDRVDKERGRGKEKVGGGRGMLSGGLGGLADGYDFEGVAMGMALGMGGVGMSRVNSGAGSEAGGVAMSRVGTQDGSSIGKRRRN